METSPPLVSVIIIFLNAERFIKEAIESVFAQTYEHWELLLVDDGSTDRSTMHALDCVDHAMGKVRYLEHDGHENRGMSAARNLGIEAARGDYVAFLDADDVWLPQHLEVYAELLSANTGAAMVYGKTQYWYDWTGRQEDQGRNFVPELGQVTTGCLIEPPDLLPLLLLGKTSVPCTNSILTRRVSLQRIGGFENSFRSAYEDQAFYAKMFLNERIIISDACLERYRQHHESSSAISRDTRRLVAERQFFLDWLEQYLLDSRIENKAVWRALNAARWRMRHRILNRVLGIFRRLFCLPSSWKRSFYRVK